MSEKTDLQNKIRDTFKKYEFELNDKELFKEICSFFEYRNIEGTKSLGMEKNCTTNAICFKTDCTNGFKEIINKISDQNTEKRKNFSNIIGKLIKEYIDSNIVDEDYVKTFNFFKENDLLYGNLFTSFKTRITAQFSTRLLLSLGNFLENLIKKRQNKTWVSESFKEIKIIFNKEALNILEPILTNMLEHKEKENNLKVAEQTIEVIFKILTYINTMENTTEFKDLEEEKKQLISRYKEVITSFLNKNKQFTELYKEELRNEKFIFKNNENMQKSYCKEQNYNINTEEQLDENEVKKEIYEIRDELDKICERTKNGNLSNYYNLLTTNIEEFNKLKNFEEKIKRYSETKILFGKQLEENITRLNFNLYKQINESNTEKCPIYNLDNFLKSLEGVSISSSEEDVSKIDNMVKELNKEKSAMRMEAYKLFENVTGDKNIDSNDTEKIKNRLKTYNKDSTNFGELKDELNCPDDKKDEKMKELRSLDDIQKIKKFEHDNIGAKDSSENNSLYTDSPKIINFNFISTDKCKKITGEFVFNNKKKGIEIEFNINTTVGNFYVNHGVRNCHMLSNILIENNGDLKKSGIKINGMLVKKFDDFKKLFIRKTDFMQAFTGCENFKKLMEELEYYGIKSDRQQYNAR